MDNLLALNYKEQIYYFPLNSPKHVSTNPEEVQQYKDMEYNPTPSSGSNFEEWYCVYLTDRCNLHCQYCFEQYTRRERDSGTEVMPDQFVQFLKSRGKKRVFIRFFGGEPLLNKDAFLSFTEKIYDYAQLNDVNVTFTLVTNGTILDNEIINIIIKYRFIINISFDGDEAMHNKNRDNSYVKIVSNMKTLIDCGLGKRLTVNMTYDIDSNARLWDCIRNTMDLGIASVSFNIPWTDGASDFALSLEKVSKICAEIDYLTEKTIAHLENNDLKYIGIHPVFSYINNWLQNTVKPDHESCTAGCGYYAINCKGEIYPCQTLEGQKTLMMGSIMDDGIIEKNMETSFIRFPECCQCDIKWICRHRCPAENYIMYGDFYKNNSYRCEINKYIFKASVAIFYSIIHGPKETSKVLTYLLSRESSKDIITSR